MQVTPPPAGPGTSEIPDTELLQMWVQHQRQGDFTELVRRHLGMVQGIACRQVGQDRAEDVAQMVFAILARKAGDLVALRSLAGWLHRVTVLQCQSMVRRQIRARRDHRSAVESARLASARDPLSEALPYLDAAIFELPDSDRELIHLRYSEGLSFTEIARRVGRSEPALRQQAHRALGKLQGLLKSRGVAVPVTTLAAGLGATFSSSSSASAASLVAMSAITSSATLGRGWIAFMTFFTMNTNQCILAGAALAALLVTGPILWQEREIQRVRSQEGAAAAMTAANGHDVPPKAGVSRRRAAAAASPLSLEEQMEKGQELLAREVKTGINDWLEQTADIDAGRIGAILELSPEKKEDLRKFFGDQAHATLASLGGGDFAKRRREEKAALEAWYAANLTPVQMEARKRMEERVQKGSVEKLAGQALYEISSIIPLTEEQKNALFRAAEAKAVESLGREESGRSMAMGLDISSGGPQPTEEVSDELLGRVLDPAQQELWRQTVKRDEIFEEELPKRLLGRAAALLKGPAGDELLKELDLPGTQH